MPETDAKTDISDKTFEDLANDTEHTILRELAREREGVNGNGSSEEIAAGLLIHEGRAEAVPDEYRDYYPDVYGDESDASADPDEDASGASEATDAAESDESEPEAQEEAEADDDAQDDEEDFTPASELRAPRLHADADWIISAEAFRSWVGKIAVLVDEAKIRLSPDGISVRAVDPANVGMVDADLDAEAFDAYNVGGEGIIGLNINRLRDVLKGADAGQLVQIEYDHERRNLVIRYGPNEFTLSLIDPDSIRKEPDLPDLDLPVQVEMDGGEHGTAVKNCDQLTDHIEYSVYPPEGGDDERLEIVGEGDTDSYSWSSDDAEEDVVFHSVPGEHMRSLYSLDYIKDVSKTFGAGDRLTVHLGDEFPIRIDAELTFEDTVAGHVTYMVAPRIQSD